MESHAFKQKTDVSTSQNVICVSIDILLISAQLQLTELTVYTAIHCPVCTSVEWLVQAVMFMSKYRSQSEKNLHHLFQQKLTVKILTTGQLYDH